MHIHRSSLITLLGIVLSAGTALAADEVFLSLTRTAQPLSRMPANIASISADRLQDLHVRDIGEALDDQPGLRRSVNGTLGAESTLMIRGATPQQTLILMDGRRINSVSLGSTDLSALSVIPAERVEIIRGAASALYGANAFGGAVNIITRAGDTDAPLIETRAEAGSFASSGYAGLFSMTADSAALCGTYSRRRSAGWRLNSDYDSATYSINAEHSTAFGRLGISAGRTDSRQGVPGMALLNPGTFTPLTIDDYDGTKEQSASSPLARQSDLSEYARLTHGIPLGSYALETAVYASGSRMTYQDPDRFSDDEYRSQIFGGDTVLRRGQGSAVLEWWEEQNRQNDRTAGTVVMDRSRVNTAGRLQQIVTLGPVSLTPVVRVDGNSVFGGMVSPALIVTADAGRGLRLSANAGKAWRAPTFNELYYRDSFGNSGNPALMPEEGLSGDLGCVWAHGKTRLSLTGFATESKNLISWVSDPVTWALSVLNINRSRQSGAEFTVSQPLASRLSHLLTYTYLWAVDIDSGQQLAYRPQHVLAYEIAWLAPTQTRFALTGDLVSSQQTGSALYPQLKEYALIGARVGQRIGRSTELWLKGDNLTGARYQTRLGYPLPGASFAAGLTVKFWS